MIVGWVSLSIPLFVPRCQPNGDSLFDEGEQTAVFSPSFYGQVFPVIIMGLLKLTH
jgi:hypothetical protein